MAAKKESDKSSRSRPATTVEGRENQLIALAVDLAEKQLRDGTATSQVMTHFLKLGSVREQLEQQRLQAEVQLQLAKIEQMSSTQRLEELYQGALDAMRIYTGRSDEDDDGYDEYD